MRMTSIITDGITKYTLIWQTLIKARIPSIGPSSASIIPKERLLSRTPRSFENLLFSCPEGVLSKKEQGLRTSPLIIYSCIF